MKIKTKEEKLETRRIYGRNIYRPKHKERLRILALEWARMNPTMRRAYKLSIRYGLSLEDYETLAKKQNYKCAICERVVEKLFVDHCHTTGIVRGLLCRRCNNALGFFNDSRYYLKRANQYLSKSYGSK